ncbi:LacI family DNA-binding transcriptional regulator [Kineococcus sp. NUM-3379]
MLADVAQLAGVSLQTVSRVVNGRPWVAGATRERVEQAIAELGYRPNVAARELVTRRSSRIGVLTTYPSLHGSAATLLGAEEAARAAGYSVSVMMVRDPWPAAVQEALEDLCAQSVGGVLAIVPEDATRTAVTGAEAALPLVLAGPEDEQAPEALVQAAAARRATEHLLDLGHRTVHHVTGPADWVEARARVQGWRDALGARRAPVPAPVQGDWSPASGHSAGHALLDAGATAVLAGNDFMAIGVMRAVVERGMTVPGDVSVVGFDDVPEAAYLNPPLTTVQLDFAAAGRRRVHALIERLTGEAASEAPTRPRLVVRASTAAPPGGVARR